MADAAEIASLITQGTKPPQGNQDVSYHTGVVKSWDPVSGVNVVDVNGVLLTNLTSIQNGMGVSYMAGDVVQIQRVQTKYSIIGRASAPNGLTGSSPVSLTGGFVSGYQTGVNYVPGPVGLSPSVTVRVGNACLVMFGAQQINTNQSQVSISIAATGPITIAPAAFSGTQCIAGSRGTDTVTSAPSKQLMFYKNSTWANGTVMFVPGVYTFSLQFKVDIFGSGTGADIWFPWLTVIPF